MRWCVLAALLATAPVLRAAYISRDLIVPVAGRAVGADGRLYLTALWVTNASTAVARVHGVFHPASATHAQPYAFAFDLGPQATWLRDPIDRSVLGRELATGWIELKSTVPILATARVYMRVPTASPAAAPTNIAAIPADAAITRAESLDLHGFTLSARYKLYLSEVDGAPLQVWVSVLDAHAATLARTFLYIDRFQQVTRDVRELFPTLRAGGVLVRVSGMHGDGRIIVAGVAIPPDGTPTAFEMNVPSAARERISTPEALAYVSITALLLLSICTRGLRSAKRES